MATDSEAARPRDAEIPLTNVRSAPKPETAVRVQFLWPAGAERGSIPRAGVAKPYSDPGFFGLALFPIGMSFSGGSVWELSMPDQSSAHRLAMNPPPSSGPQPAATFG